MIYRIPKGKHRAVPVRFGLWFKKTLTYRVVFYDSCRYDLKNVNQGDINKLVGFSYLNGPHHDSARFGWVYDIPKDRIELYAYCYVGRKRKSKFLCDVDFNEEYRIELCADHGLYYFFVDRPETRYGKLASKTIEYTHDRKVKYRLGIWFGGNETAPAEMKIKLDKL